MNCNCSPTTIDTPPYVPSKIEILSQLVYIINACHSCNDSRKLASSKVAQAALDLLNDLKAEISFALPENNLIKVSNISTGSITTNNFQGLSTNGLIIDAI